MSPLTLSLPRVPLIDFTLSNAPTGVKGLTKSEGYTGRILAEVNDSIIGLSTARSIQDRKRADTCILPVRFQASLADKRLNMPLKKSLNVFPNSKTETVYLA